MSRVPGEPMTSYISRRRRWWTLVHEMDNTLELGDTVQGSMMLEQAGLSWFEQNILLLNMVFVTPSIVHSRCVIR